MVKYSSERLNTELEACHFQGGEHNCFIRKVPEVWEKDRLEDKWKEDVLESGLNSSTSQCKSRRTSEMGRGIGDNEAKVIAEREGYSMVRIAVGKWMLTQARIH